MSERAQIYRPTNAELWERIEAFIEAHRPTGCGGDFDANCAADDASFAVHALKMQPSAEKAGE